MNHEPTDQHTIGRLRELVSHDLKNPISAAWTTSAFMAELIDSADELTQRNLSTIRSALTRALEWIDDFGVTVQLETGELAPSRSEADAAALAQRLIEALPEPIAKGVSLSGWDGRVQADPDLLLRCLRSLVLYADERGARSGGVTLSLTREPGGVDLVCSDRGRAIPSAWEDEGIPSLDQAVPAATPKPPLSLLLCQAVARSHGGSLYGARVDGENRLTMTVRY